MRFISVVLVRMGAAALENQIREFKSTSTPTSISNIDVTNIKGSENFMKPQLTLQKACTSLTLCNTFLTLTLLRLDYT